MPLLNVRLMDHRLAGDGGRERRPSERIGTEERTAGEVGLGCV